MPTHTSTVSASTDSAYRKRSHGVSKVAPALMMSSSSVSDAFLHGQCPLLADSKGARAVCGVAPR